MGGDSHTQQENKVVGRPNIRRGMFLRHLSEALQNVDLSDIDPDTIMTHEMGALVRDAGGHDEAFLVVVLRRKVIDPNLSYTHLSKYVRRKKR